MANRALPRALRAVAHPNKRRCYSSAVPAATGNERLDAWIRERTTTVTRAYDTLDPLRARQLHRTLPIRQRDSQLHDAHDGSSALAWPETGEGRPLPAGHHMAYFQPEDWLDELAKDGTSTEYNAPDPYSLRMWAGGSMRWNPANPLLVGSKVTQILRVDKVEMKKNMVFVHQRRDLYPGAIESEPDPNNWAMSEIRTHVFRQPAAAASAALKPKPSARPTQVDWTYRTSYMPTSPLLFRFSALTFNGHKIHYDRDWTREREGHPDLVVHGPMNATLLVDMASAIASRTGRTLHSFRYRATSPMYVDKEIRLVARFNNGDESDGATLQLEAQQGEKTGMTATAKLEADA